jgi:divalent metal cation (Fe/Co/Zn/Cd) transporter
VPESRWPCVYPSSLLPVVPQERPSSEGRFFSLGNADCARTAEDRAQKLVAIQFFILAPYVAYESVNALIDGHHAEDSIVGIALAASSLVLMPWLGRAKQRIGARIGSSATASEGKQNLLCAYLAGAVLTGLLGDTLFGAWWLDPLVGLLIAALAVQEGREAWRGDACCE